MVMMHPKEVVPTKGDFMCELVACSPRLIPMPKWQSKDLVSTPPAQTRPSNKELSGRLQDTVGELLKFYSRSPATPICGSPAINGEMLTSTRGNMDDLLANKQGHVATVGPPGKLLPFTVDTVVEGKSVSSPCQKNPVKLDTSYIHGDIRKSSKTPSQKIPVKLDISLNRGDAEQKVCQPSRPTIAKLKIPANDFTATLGPPGLFLPNRLGTEVEGEAFLEPRSKSISPEPEPLTAGSADRQRALYLEVPRPPNSFAKANLSSWQPECEQEVQDLTPGGRQNVSIQDARDVAAAGGGLCGYTTVMMQQIPFKYTQSKLMTEIHEDGFAGAYDFFYLPANARNDGNRGFGFINFLSASLADKFYSKYHAKRLKHYEASLSIAVIPANSQGFEESAACFLSSWQLRKKNNSMPVFLKPVPSLDKLEGQRKGK